MIAVTCSILFTNLRLSSGFSYEQAPYSYVLVQVVLVWKGHFQILSTDLSGPRISLLSMCSIACASSYDLHCVFNKFNRKNICKTFNIQHALTAKMARCGADRGQVMQVGKEEVEAMGQRRVILPICTCGFINWTITTSFKIHTCTGILQSFFHFGTEATHSGGWMDFQYIAKGWGYV